MVANNEKLLSIVVPTLNRKTLLAETLYILLKDIQGFESEVELIVINNSSDDDTEDFVRTKLSDTVIKFFSFADRVNIDDSFLRCVNNSNGKFINIFGDDDLPFPGYIRSLLEILNTDTNLGLIYLNRLIGDETLSNFGEIAHSDSGLASQVLNTNEFISKFTHWPGFVSALIFNRDCWIDGESYYRHEFLGYKFLARVYAGLGTKNCVYVGIPHLAQRRGLQSWKSEWPRFWLVNMPNLLKTLESSGITYGALSRWQTHEVTFKRLIIDCLVAKAYGYRLMDPFWFTAARYQTMLRAVAVHLIQIFIPCFLVRTVYFSFGKYGK